MNCYICGGFLVYKDKHIEGKKIFHKNCWIRLNREQQKLLHEVATFKTKVHINLTDGLYTKLEITK